MRIRHILVLSTLATLGTLLGCGGGGSGSSSSDSTPVEITTANATTIASDVMSAIMLSADLSTIPGALFSGEVFPSTADAEGADAAPLRGLAAALAITGAAEIEPPPSLPGGGATASAPFDPFTEDCDVSGDVTISGNISGPEPAPGDRIRARFDECVNLDDDGYGLPALDGGLEFTITALTGDLESLFMLVLALTFDELVAGEGMDELTTDGDATIEYDHTVANHVLSEAEGESIRFTNGAGDSLTIRRMDTLFEQDMESETYDVFGDGRVSSSAFPGQVAFEVQDTLTGDMGGEAVEHPFEGEVEVFGDDTKMLILVENETDLELWIDVDDDGIYDEILPKTWADLGF
jgi:hypothetical protein